MTEDIRGYLANFEKTAKYAWDYNIPETELYKIAAGFGLL